MWLTKSQFYTLAWWDKPCMIITCDATSRRETEVSTPLPRSVSVLTQFPFPWSLTYLTPEIGIAIWMALVLIKVWKRQHLNLIINLMHSIWSHSSVMRNSFPVRFHADNYNNINLCLVNSGPHSNSSQGADLFKHSFTLSLQGGGNMMRCGQKSSCNKHTLFL